MVGVHFVLNSDPCSAGFTSHCGKIVYTDLRSKREHYNMACNVIVLELPCQEKLSTVNARNAKRKASLKLCLAIPEKKNSDATSVTTISVWTNCRMKTRLYISACLVRHAAQQPSAKWGLRKQIRKDINANLKLQQSD